MSGRRIRRPGAAPTRPRRAREKEEGRGVQQKVLATGAAILLAGTAVTFVLEQAVLTPRRQVQAESALPVYSAVGQRTDDVSFWPWTYYAEHAGQEPSLMPVEDEAYMGETLVMFCDALLGGGGVEIETADALVESYYDPRSSCQYLRDLTVLWTPPEGGETRTLTLNMAQGGGNDPALTFGTAMSFVMKAADQTPTEAQLEAAYRQVLLDLYFQCGAAGWLLDDAAASEIMEATPAPADTPSDPSREAASQLPPSDGALSDEAVRRLQRAAQMPLENLMDRLGAQVAEQMAIDEFVLQWPAGLGPDTALWPTENSPDPVALAAGALSEEDTHKLEQRLQQQYAEYGTELQVVTLSDSVLVLFSSGVTLGFYYDPVLEVWSGFAVQ